MTLEQISWASQTVAALAVIASLIYAALQFRIYAKQAREGRYLAAEAEARDFRMMLATDPDCARIFHQGLAGYEGLSVPDKQRFNMMMLMLVSGFQRIMMFEDVYGKGLDKMMARTMRLPGVRAWWAQAGRVSYTPAMADRIDRIIAVEAPGAIPFDGMAPDR